MLFSPNFRITWPEIPLGDAIANAVGLPVDLHNDVRSITFGKWKFRTGQGVDTIACFAVGTSIDGGLVVNG